jgi:hypothetical protein
MNIYKYIYRYNIYDQTRARALAWHTANTQSNTNTIGANTHITSAAVLSSVLHTKCSNKLQISLATCDLIVSTWLSPAWYLVAPRGLRPPLRPLFGPPRGHLVTWSPAFSWWPPRGLRTSPRPPHPGPLRGSGTTPRPPRPGPICVSSHYLWTK